jgi:hypothetical protein
MEPALRNLLFCEAVVPAPASRFNCYGVFTDLFSSTFPVNQPRFTILTSWTGATGFHIQVIKMLNPAKSMVLHQSPEMYFTLEHESQTCHIQVDINQAVFTEPGAYVFQVYLDGRLLAEHRLNYHRK